MRTPMHMVGDHDTLVSLIKAEYPTIQIYDYYGNEWTQTADKWEASWEAHRYAYLGRCLVNGDSVMFHGNLQQGGYTVHDGSEVCSELHWHIADE